MTTRPRILIVDDEPLNVDYLEQELEDLNYETVSAANGQEALEMVRASAPDLILLDIMMPIMDGFSVLEQLKANPATRDIPVIIISANNDLQSVVRGIKMGAEDYLPKPFEPVLLHARIAAGFEKKSLRDQQRKLLHTFASKEVAELLMADGFSLGGKRISASIMFADIRSFTSIAENQEPSESIDLLNHYFSLMFDAITNNGGTVNQVVGDGLMAVFGAPIFFEDHSERAVRAALQMLEQLKVFNHNQAAHGKTQIRIGIGIATGQMVAGYTGTQTRAIYTCIGDTVNVASRIEEYTKEALHPILIDNYTRQNLPADILVEDLGKIVFKGKNQAINVFAVMGSSA